MSDFICVMPPGETSTGCRLDDGTMWFPCVFKPGTRQAKPGIAVCEHPGNLVNPACYRLLATFEHEADRDFVLKLHRDYVAAKPKDAVSGAINSLVREAAQLPEYYAIKLDFTRSEVSLSLESHNGDEIEVHGDGPQFLDAVQTAVTHWREEEPNDTTD